MEGGYLLKIYNFLNSLADQITQADGKMAIPPE